MIDIQQLEKASATYYGGNPIMTDAEFDAAVAELREKDPDHPFLKRIGAPVPGKFKVEHRIPMGSLDNANNEDEFRTWILKHKGCAFSLSHKLDGSSLELVYQDGHFIQAITRGDGKIGEDVTRNVLRSGNIPLTIDSSIISVRCECLIYLKDWHKYFEGDANPRNSAAGTLRRHDGHNAEYLRFYAFDALIDISKATKDIRETIKSEDDILDMLVEWFCVPYCGYTINIDNLIQWYRYEEVRRDKWPYEIDGIVAKIEDRIKSQNMGSKDGRPRGQVAIKFKPRGGETILQDVTWQVGQTGALTPVGKVAPIGVGGVIIKRVTLCNMDEIDRLGITIGDTVEIVRAGDVIPKLTKCIRQNESSKVIYPPKKCPECGASVTKDGARLFCRNDLCEGKSLGRIMTWIKKRNILNLGIGIVEAAGIESIYHLYKMSSNEWANVRVKNGMLGPKRAAKVMEALNKSKSVSLSEFLGSIGIKGIGRSLSYDLCKGLKLKIFNDIFALTSDQVELQGGFGPLRAKAFCQWLRENCGETQDLASIMNFTKELDVDKNTIFSGEMICFTGKSPKPRSEMGKLAEAAGAIVSNSISKDTTILVIVDPNSTSSKAVKARKNGIKLMSPEEFLVHVGV